MAIPNRETGDVVPAEYVNQIVLGDCLDVMGRIPEGTIDMTFADPPFNLRKKYGLYEDSKDEKDYLEWCQKWIEELVRITKPSGSIFVHNIPRWLSHYASVLHRTAFFKHWICWDAGGAPMGKTLLPNHYGILWYAKSGRAYKFFDVRSPHKKCRKCGENSKNYGGKSHLAHEFGPLVSDVWDDISRIRNRSRRDDHPCQLPVALMERIVLMSTDVGDIVLDPFVGTGTTAVAAKKLGREYVGIEIDKQYVDIAVKKIDDAIVTRRNGAYVSEHLGELRTIRDVDCEKVISKTLPFSS